MARRRRRGQQETVTSADVATVDAATLVAEIPPGHKKPPHPAPLVNTKKTRHFECENACLFLISSVGGWQLSQMLEKTTAALERLELKPDPDKACQLEPVGAVNGSLDDITTALHVATKEQAEQVLSVDATIRRILGK